MRLLCPIHGNPLKDFIRTFEDGETIGYEAECKDCLQKISVVEHEEYIEIRVETNARIGKRKDCS